MRWRSLLAQMVLALTLPIASADVWAQPQDITGVWRDEIAQDEDAMTPKKIVLPQKPAKSNNFHGTYASKPYLLINVQDKKDPQSPIFLYSDVGDLRVQLVRSTAPNPPGATWTDYDMVDRHQDSKKIIGTLRMDASECNGRKSCFTLRPPTKDKKETKDTLDAFAKVLGFDTFRDTLPVLYIPVGRYIPKLDPQLQQTFGDMFSPLSANFWYILKCWHLGKMNPIDYQIPGCGQDIFEMPDTKSFGYRKVGFANWHNAAIPFAWTYVSTLFQNGEDLGQTWENGQDVADADSLKIGAKVSTNVFGVTTKTHVSVGVQHKVENMYNSKLTYAKAEYLSTQFALVLHKHYAVPLLYRRFRDRVDLLLKIEETNREEEYDRFVSDFGTHYANAITFGSKGERVLQMTQQQVLAMHEGQINVSAGISAGYMGNGAKVDVDFSKSHMDKITSNTSREDRQWVCYSGGACNDGIPSGDAVLPVQLDLRPISDLFAPPFFNDDETITTMRDGISRAIARAAFVERNNLSVPTAVFATVTGLDRYNITAQGPQPCSEDNPCNPVVVTLTSEDNSPMKPLDGSEAPPITRIIPATLDPTQTTVTANFTWSGSCPQTASRWEHRDSVSTLVTYNDLDGTIVIENPGVGSGVLVPGNSSGGPLSSIGSGGQVAEKIGDPLSNGLDYIQDPKCSTSDNLAGLITARKGRTITKVDSAGSLLGQ